jgi:hypothetical protein
MNGIETRLRRTLDEVAAQTIAEDRYGSLPRRSRPPNAPALVAAALALGLLAMGLLPVFGGDGAPDPLSTPSGPDGSTWEVDPAWLAVDPEDIAVFDDLTAIHTTSGKLDLDPAWRHPLRSELVWCLYQDGPGSDTRASQFPLAEDLTGARIEAACADTDAARNQPAALESPTLCRGVYDPASQRELLASQFEVIERSSGAAPGFPVALGWEADCDNTRVSTNPAVTLDGGLSLEEVNRVRDIEIAIIGASFTHCLTFPQATELARAAREALGAGWMLMAATSVTTDGSCYQPILDLDWGTVYVAGRLYEELGEEAPGTPPTLPPISGS